MKLTPWYLVALAPIAVAGCSGAFLGHCAVLAVTVCIFIGTLSLGKHAAPAGRSMDAPAGAPAVPSADAPNARHTGDRR